MKRILIALVAAILALSSCADLFRDELAELHSEIDDLKNAQPEKDTTSHTNPKTITISFDSGSQRIGISANEAVSIGYTLSEGNSSTIVAVATDGNYAASVTKTDNTHGRINVTCPLQFAAGTVNVLVYDGNGGMTMSVLEFYERELSFSSGTQFSVEANGGKLEIPYTTNFDFKYSVGANSSWLAVSVNKRDNTSGSIIVEVPKNTGTARTGYINLAPTYGSDKTFTTITINQASSYYEIDYSTFLSDSNGGQFVSTIKTSRGVKVVIPSEASWVTYSMTSSGNEYKVTFTVAANTTSNRKDATIDIYATDGTEEKIGVIQIGQLSPSTDNAKMMVFEVRASGINDYDVYLPLAGRLDCYVYWGDGQTERFRGDNYQYVHHKYNVDRSTDFEVQISGSVTCLDAREITEYYKYGIIAVKQWGMTGLTSMGGAFQDIWSLKSIPADVLGSFANVTNFGGAFSGCSSLQEIPYGLFNYGQKIDELYSTFSGCSSIQSIPARLFENCISVKNTERTFRDCRELRTLSSESLVGLVSVTKANYMFSGCNSLQKLPDNLFSPLSACVEFEGTLWSCKSLESVPANLFSGCTSAEYFSSIFGICSKLKKVPADLFKNNTRVTNFAGAFSSSGLESIPESIFSYCPYVRSFQDLFAGCGSLKTVPVSLFNNNQYVTNFSNCFLYCSNIQGESPYSKINGSKVHLYERASYPDTFMKVSNTSSCFSGASFSDFDNIPNDWK